MKNPTPDDDTTRPFAARKWLLLGFGTLAALALALGGWGTGATISGAVIAAGRIAPKGHVQRVEHLGGGTVRQVFVGDGDVVAEGDLLLRLDDEELQAEHNVLTARLAETAALRSRLEAEIAGAHEIAWDGSLAAAPAALAAMEGQQRLFDARLETRRGVIAQLRQRIVQSERQVESLEAQAKAVEKQRGFLAEEVESFRAARQRNLAALQEITAREREMANLEGQTGDIRARAAAARSRSAEYELQILQIDARRSEEAELQARQAEAREIETRERLTQVGSRLAGTRVRAPVAGEVFAMQVFSRGEVINPGEVVLSILPRDARLVLRAQVEPIHIDQVWQGQEATVVFPALAQRTTPAFEGTVTRVAADAVTDPQSRASWYEVEIELGNAVRGAARAALQADTLALVPGMPAQAQLRTGDRSPASYLLKPLTDYFAQALRER